MLTLKQGDSRGKSMTTLTITAKQVTLKRDLLRHLGVGPGEKVEIDKLPDGQIVVRAVTQNGPITNFIGCLSRKSRAEAHDRGNEGDRGRRMSETKMKITADTSVLVRAAVQDDARQARRAGRVLQEADLVAVPIPVPCEFVGVLRRG